MTGTENKTAARAAAEWWAEQIGAPVHKAIGDDPNGPDRFAGDFAFMAMQIVASKDPVSDDQGSRFASDLERRVADLIERGSDWISFGVDYGPDRILADAADEAKVAYSRFPWKTNMTVTPDYVTASLGYHGQAKLIWQSPGWDRPPCGSMAYDEPTRRFDEKLCGLPRFHEDREHGDWQPDTARCARADCGKSQAEHWNSESIRHTFDRGGVS